MTNPIETVVLPLKVDAVERAEKEAKAVIARVEKGLEEAGWDLNVAAPYPRDCWAKLLPRASVRFTVL